MSSMTTNNPSRRRRAAFERPCRECGQPTEYMWCEECCKKDIPRCPHGNRPHECNACMIESDLAYDSWRESR